MSFVHEARERSVFQSILYGLADIKEAFTDNRVVLVFAWQDIRQRYQRSVLGPFWITIAMGVLIGAMGVVFGQVLKSPMDTYLPFLTLGLIYWTLISSVIQEGCTAFISSEGIIRQMPIALTIHIFRTFWRNVLIFAHNIVIFPLVCFVFHKPIGIEALYIIPGFILVSLFLMWIEVVCGVLCTRFRDMTQIVTSIMQVVFYITPVIWMPGLIPGKSASLILDPNPFYHVLRLVREPLLGVAPTMTNWMAVGGMTVVGWLFALWLLGRARDRLAYWL